MAYERRQVAMHWDGSRWTIVPTPKIHYSDLRGVSAVAADDVWAVGSAGHGRIEHWNGRRWRVVPDAPITGGYRFYAVHALSASDIWAVGTHSPGAHQKPETLTEHWDGSSWTVVPSPGSGLRANLLGVSGAAPDDVWAVGFVQEMSDVPASNLILHWNGSAWRELPAVDTGISDDSLHAVSAVTPDDAWAVGTSHDLGGPLRTVVLHWDGRTWKVVSSPNVGSGQNILFGVAAGPRVVWAVGRYRREDRTHTLTMRSCPS
jgi:hypothetical protein